MREIMIIFNKQIVEKVNKETTTIYPILCVDRLNEKDQISTKNFQIDSEEGPNPTPKLTTSDWLIG